VKLQVYGGGIGWTGYGRMTNEIKAALERAGVEVLPYDRSVKADYILFACPPQRPEGWWKGQKVVLLTMWESSELAFEHLTSVPLFDKILVPSVQNMEMFSKINPDTEMFTLGCDYDTWRYVPRSKTEPFTVITGGKGGRRKGIDIAIKVFRRFSSTIQHQDYPAPRLIIRSGVTLSKKYDDIVVMDETLSEEDEAALYATGHAYLGLSRGEGWGMIPHQTIAQGMPTILTDAHGHKAFSHLGLPVSWTEVPAETEVVGRSGNWWEPDEDEALAHLLDVFYNYDEHLKLAAKNAEYIRSLTWDLTAEQILAALPEPEEITDEWVVCPQTYLTVRVTGRISCSIAEQDHTFLPGEEYQVTADVKRVLFDAGYLEDSCIDPFERAQYLKPKPAFIDEGIAA